MKLLNKTTRSATFEIENNSIYFLNNPLEVKLNNQVVKEILTNVFSLFKLEPSTTYEVNAGGQTLVFTTQEETAFIDVAEIFDITLNINQNVTHIIQEAINIVKPNSTLYFKAGKYLTGPLFLKDNITIYLDLGAEFVGLTERSAYPFLPKTMAGTDISTWEGELANTYASLITGINIKNVQITGEGVIECNAHRSSWWVEAKSLRNVYRPFGVYFAHCENITFSGVTIQNTPSWAIHPFLCDSFNLYDIKVNNPKDSPNTDGFDPNMTININCIGSYFSVGDDCIALKSGKFALGEKYKRGSENIVIRNCLMAYGHGAITIGSEMSGGIKNLEVSQCFFKSTDRGFRIKTRRGRGKYGVIQNVAFNNCVMDNVLVPFVINMFYYCDLDGKTEYVWSKEKLPVDDKTPHLSDFEFSNIKCFNVNAQAGFFYGLPESPIDSISLKNISFYYKEDGIEFYPAMMSFLEKVKGEGLYFNNVKKVKLENVVFENISKQEIVLENVENYERDED
jgi:polygalacturonase